MIDLFYIALKQWKFAIMAALGLYIGWQHLQIAHKDARIAGLEADVKIMSERVVQAQKAVATAKGVNDENMKSLDQINEAHRARIEALSAELARVTAEKQQVQVVRKVIREKAKACDGVVPPGVGAALDWLRSNPARSPGGPDADPGRTPVRP